MARGPDITLLVPQEDIRGGPDGERGLEAPNSGQGGPSTWAPPRTGQVGRRLWPLN